MNEAHTLPADWWPAAPDYARAVERYPDLDVEALTRRFVAAHRGSRKRRKDWTATWRSTIAQLHDEHCREREWQLRKAAEAAAVEARTVRQRGHLRLLSA